MDTGPSIMPSCTCMIISLSFQVVVPSHKKALVSCPANITVPGEAPKPLPKIEIKLPIAPSPGDTRSIVGLLSQTPSSLLQKPEAHSQFSVQSQFSVASHTSGVQMPQK